MSDNIIQVNKDLIHTELKDLVKNSVEETLNAMLDAEADKLVNAEHYARDEERRGYRAGHYKTQGRFCCLAALAHAFRTRSVTALEMPVMRLNWRTEI